MKFRKLLVSIVIFIITLFIVYMIHINFFNVDVIFYSAILDALVALILTSILIKLSKYFQVFTQFEKIQIGIIHVLLGYIIAISGPTVIDRSLSFYILEKLEQRGGGIKQSRFNDIFTKEFIHEYRLSDVRLTEQLESGTITIDDGCVKLTDKGYALIKVSKFIRSNLLAKNRLLMGEYTDDLVKPYRKDWLDKNETLEYICK